MVVVVVGDSGSGSIVVVVVVVVVCSNRVHIQLYTIYALQYEAQGMQGFFYVTHKCNQS